MFKLKYIKTMDMLFENVVVLNCVNITDLSQKIKENEVIKISNDAQVEYINSSYIMYFA